MADDRPTFEDPAHLLATPDPEAQAAVAARIKQAMNKGQRRPAKDAGGVTTTEQDGHAVVIIHTDPDHGKRMEERLYRVTVAQVADLWGVSVPTARNRIKNPAEIEGLDAELLAEKLGVTVDWLRYGGTNGYGLWEDAAVVELLYAELGNDDKQLVCDLIKRLIGPGATKKVEQSRRWARMERNAENHPEVWGKIRETISRLISREFDPIAARLQDYARRVVAAHDDLVARGMEPAEIEKLDASEILRLAKTRE